MGCGGHLADQPCQQGAQDIRRRGPDLLSATALRSRRGREGQGQRIAAGETQYPVAQFGPDACRGQQTVGLFLGERPQFGDVQEPGPGWIGGPLRLRRVPAGEDHQSIVRAAGQEMVPQPTLQPLTVLERVHQQHRPRNVEEGTGGPLEVGRVPADEPAVELDQPPARRTGVVRQAPQQRRLPDAARPAHEERERGPRITGQGLSETLDLPFPPDECPNPRSAQSFPDRCHTGSRILLLPYYLTSPRSPSSGWPETRTVVSSTRRKRPSGAISAKRKTSVTETLPSCRVRVTV